MAEKQSAETSEFAVPSYGKYYPPRYDYRTLPTVKLDYFLVLDFEGVINKDPGCPNVMEIIEFPVLKVNARSLETESIFHSYVQPVIHPKLNPICTELTGITQDMVDGQPILPEVLKSLDAWMKSEGLLEKGVEFCFVTVWGLGPEDRPVDKLSLLEAAICRLPQAMDQHQDLLSGYCWQERVGDEVHVERVEA